MLIVIETAGINAPRIVHPQFPPEGWTTTEHVRIAREWPDGYEMLENACKCGLSVAEMRAWRRAKHGEDLTAVSEGE